MIGTQAADDPRRATTSLRPSSLFGDSRLLDDRSQSATPFKVDLQNISDDPGSCRAIGNVDETYCY